MTQQKVNTLNTYLLSGCMALLSGAFIFCWRTNAQTTLLVDHDNNKTESIKSIELNVRGVHDDMTKMQIQIQRLEDKTDLKTQIDK